MLQGRTKDGHRRCGAANPLLSSGVLFPCYERVPHSGDRIALTHQVQGDQKTAQLAFPKKNPKKEMLLESEGLDRHIRVDHPAVVYHALREFVYDHLCRREEGGVDLVEVEIGLLEDLVEGFSISL